MIFAHRGSYGKKVRDENTLKAFEAALKSKKFSGFECDVRISKDQKPVLIHDASLLRTHGEKVYVNHLAAKDLEKYGIPTLSSTLNLLKKFENKGVIIDIKTSKAQKVVNFVEDYLKKNSIPSDKIFLLLWQDKNLRTSLKILRAFNYYLKRGKNGKRKKIQSYFDGVTLKLDLKNRNVETILETLKSGRYVNIYGEDSKKLIKFASSYPTFKKKMFITV